MKSTIFCLAALFAALPAFAQQSGVPPEVAAQLRAIGPVIDVPAVSKIYAPLQADAPRDGVKQTKDVKYGKDDRHRLDIYEPATRATSPMPVFVFIHGGGFVRGDKSTPGTPFYDNIGYYFARHGVLAILATYRLAPQNQWPAGAKDVGAVIQWTRANAARFGGDPKRIVLMGHSAGAAHVAAYGLDKGLQPKDGPGVAGLILMAGVYDPEMERRSGTRFGPGPKESNEAYYGKPAKYAERAPIRHMTGPTLPVMLIVSELDPPMMHIETGALYTALCYRDKVCPELVTPRDHDHISEAYAINTPDETVSGPVLAFIQARK